MTGLVRTAAIGAPVARIDGPAKVTGSAPYAFECRLDRPVYAHLVQATVARGWVTAIDVTAAQALDGVLFVLTHQDMPRLASDHDRELWVLQSGQVWYRGQVIGVAVADSIEIAREAARLVTVQYQAEPHEVRLRADSQDLYKPQTVNPALVTDTAEGDVAAALAAAPVRIDATYTTPAEYHNPIEPHTTVAIWAGAGDAEHLTMYDSNQGASRIAEQLAQVFGLNPSRVTVISPFVGGAFGSKSRAKAHQVAAALAARQAAGRPVKLALTRRQMFAGTGYRTPTIQRVQLGARADGTLTAIAHDAISQTARFKEFAEQTALGTRTMYAAPHRRMSWRPPAASTRSSSGSATSPSSTRKPACPTPPVTLPRACARERAGSAGSTATPPQGRGPRTAGWPGPASPPPPTRCIPTPAARRQPFGRSPVAGTGWRSGPPISAPGRGPC